MFEGLADLPLLLTLFEVGALVELLFAGRGGDLHLHQRLLEIKAEGHKGLAAGLNRLLELPDFTFVQEQLALAVGTDQARISRIENAGDNPSYGLVERIAKALELELWELAKQAGELETSD